MKKISILAFLLMALAVFSLSACNADVEEKKEDYKAEETDEKESTDAGDDTDAEVPEIDPSKVYNESNTNKGSAAYVTPQIIFENESFLIAATGLDCTDYSYKAIINFDFKNKSDRAVNIRLENLALNNINADIYGYYTINAGETKAMSFGYPKDMADKAMINVMKEVAASFRIKDDETSEIILHTGLLKFSTNDTSDYKQETNFKGTLIKSENGVEIYTTGDFSIDNAGHLTTEIYVKNFSEEKIAVKLSSITINSKNVAGNLELTLNSGLTSFANVAVYKRNLTAAELTADNISTIDLDFDIEFLK